MSKANYAALHHIQHWAHGGPTDINNMTLLCTRHHVIVHRDHYTAEVTTTGPGVMQQRWHRQPDAEQQRRPGSRSTCGRGTSKIAGQVNEVARVSAAASLSASTTSTAAGELKTISAKLQNVLAEFQLADSR